MIRHVDGDLIDMAKAGDFDTIVHGCNCFNVMGAGIALQIAEQFPQALAADTAFYHRHYGSLSQPGKVSLAMARCGDKTLRIFNAYTQWRPGKPTKSGVDSADDRLTWIRMAFMQIRKSTDERNRIGVPKIGAGLAGGDWEKIEKIIAEVMHERDVTVVNWKPA